MNREEVIIVGGGPCGLAAAIACKEVGIDPLVIEKEQIVQTIYRFPTHQIFFSSSDKLEIGGVPFLVEGRKPSRNEALVYYREVVKRKQIRVHTYEKVEKIKKENDETFIVFTSKREYRARYVIVATGYYDSPNLMGIRGEEKPHVFHYFKEAHPFFNEDVVVIGGRNSAVDACLELEKAGARVTNLYRGETYSNSIKPWILPEFQALVRDGRIKLVFRAEVLEITDEDVVYRVGNEIRRQKARFVFAMTGYHPDHSFLRSIGVEVDETTGRPTYDEKTMETNVSGLFIAGVIAAGNNANEIFIENGRFHGEKIANVLKNR